MRLFLSIILSSVLVINSAANPTFASTFETQYELTYDIAEDGRTAVVMDVQLTNQSTNVFAQHYILTVHNHHIDNVVATSSEGPLAVSVKEEGKATEVIVTFYDKAIGKGSTKAFRLTYDTSDLVVHKGETWELAIPPVSTADSISSYSVNLLIPPSFGTFHRFSPEIHSQSDSTITWNFQGTAGATIYGTISKEKITSSPTLTIVSPSKIEVRKPIHADNKMSIISALVGLLSGIAVLFFITHKTR